MQDSDLDDLFAIARQQRQAVTVDLMTRTLADADVLQPGTTASAVAARGPRLGFVTALWAAIGGAGGLAGLSTAALAGVWIGFAQPAALASVILSASGSEKPKSKAAPHPPARKTMS